MVKPVAFYISMARSNTALRMTPCNTCSEVPNLVHMQRREEHWVERRNQPSATAETASSLKHAALESNVRCKGPGNHMPVFVARRSGICTTGASLPQNLAWMRPAEGPQMLLFIWPNTKQHLEWNCPDCATPAPRFWTACAFKGRDCRKGSLTHEALERSLGLQAPAEELIKSHQPAQKAWSLDVTQQHTSTVFPRNTNVRAHRQEQGDCH